jgi:hypothetical protein
MKNAPIRARKWKKRLSRRGVSAFIPARPIRAVQFWLW